MGAREDAVDALREVAFALERRLEPMYRVKAFRTAAAAIAGMADGELEQRAGAGTLTDVTGIGAATAAVVGDALAGRRPGYLERVDTGPLVTLDDEAHALLATQVGDCHSHSDWSDGGSPIEEMAATAAALGRRWQALTDHSPRLTVARGLTAERLRRQLTVVAKVDKALRGSDFRLLTGIEVDILDDGALDQEDALLEELDVVVASVHSHLRMDRAAMTRRMVRAVTNPRVDVLGHCTGRLLGTKKRPESTFDADAVFGAAAEHGTAVEVNCRPERLDPPTPLLRRAIELGCLLSVDTDAHAPGQLDWQPYGCERLAPLLAEAGLAGAAATDRVVTTWSVDRLLSWTGAPAA